MKHFADNNQRAFQFDNSSSKNIQGVVMEHDPPNTTNPCSTSNPAKWLYVDSQFTETHKSQVK